MKWLWKNQTVPLPSKESLGKYQSKALLWNGFQNPGVAWVGRDFQNSSCPKPSPGEGQLQPAQVVQCIPLSTAYEQILVPWLRLLALVIYHFKGNT